MSRKIQKLGFSPVRNVKAILLSGVYDTNPILIIVDNSLRDKWSVIRAPCYSDIYFN